jgi:hypothetical protein
MNVVFTDASERERLLWGAVAALADEAFARREREAELVAKIAELEARTPPARFSLPGWLTVKQAANASGLSVPSIYRLVGLGRIVGVKHEGRMMIDPETLQARK